MLPRRGRGLVKQLWIRFQAWAPHTLDVSQPGGAAPFLLTELLGQSQALPAEVATNLGFPAPVLDSTMAQAPLLSANGLLEVVPLGVERRGDSPLLLSWASTEGKEHPLVPDAVLTFRHSEEVRMCGLE